MLYNMHWHSNEARLARQWRPATHHLLPQPLPALARACVRFPVVFLFVRILFTIYAQGPHEPLRHRSLSLGGSVPLWSHRRLLGVACKRAPVDIQSFVATRCPTEREGPAHDTNKHTIFLGGEANIPMGC